MKCNIVIMNYSTGFSPYAEGKGVAFWNNVGMLNPCIVDRSVLGKYRVTF